MNQFFLMGQSFAISSNGSVLHFPKYKGHFSALSSADPSDLANPPLFRDKRDFFLCFDDTVFDKLR